VIDSIVKYIIGIVKLRGASDNTQIGNISDRLKVTLAATAGTCTEVSIPLANTEVSHNLGEVKRFTLKLRGQGTLRVSYASGGDYITIPRGASYSEFNIDTASSFTLYFQSSIASETLELVTWT
jgi:hypothetical protein